jgi:hypothetical protein
MFCLWTATTCRRFEILAATLCLAALAGCQKPAPTTPTAAHDHGHAETGPHKGQLLELGEEEYHAELVHDDATYTIMIYVLDKAAKDAVPIDAKELPLNIVVDGNPIQFTLPAAPQPGDPAGKSSCFKLTNQQLCEAMDDPATTGRFNLTIGDKPYSAALVADAHAHSHEGHVHK